MAQSDIFMICSTVAIVIAALRAAYGIGRRIGYWERVDEEKAARGIR